MKETPWFDQLSTPLLALFLIALLGLQWQFPLRRQHFTL